MMSDDIYKIVITENFIEKEIDISTLDDVEVVELKFECVRQCRYAAAALLRSYQNHLEALQIYLKIFTHVPKNNRP